MFDQLITRCRVPRTVLGIQTVDGRFSDRSGVSDQVFLSCLGVAYVIIYAKLCENLKHIGYFTHIIIMCDIYRHA